MTAHQRARRAKKSRLFFAKLAERAALAGQDQEARRLHTAIIYKTAAMLSATAVKVAESLPLAA